MNNSNERLPLSDLPDGTYSGTMSGWTFKHNEKQYAMDFGVRGINCPMAITVSNGKTIDYNSIH